MALSFVHGIDSMPLTYNTIGQEFDVIADRFAANDALVVVHQSIRWSYTELKERADRMAAGLIALGLQPGDRIGIWASNCAEWVVTQIASAKAGLILVNINPAYRLSELQYCLQKVGCRALVTAERTKSSDYLRMLQSLVPELSGPTDTELRSEVLPELRWVIRLGEERTPGFLNFADIPTLAGPSEATQLLAIGANLQPDSPVNIQFTSGTTGRPKGATLSHLNILNNALFVGRGMHLTERDRICIPVPLYHCFGMVMGNLAAITHGATMIYPAETFDPRCTLKTIQDEKATAVYGVPTMFIAGLDHPEFSSYDLSTLRTGIMAGSPCPIELMKRVVRDMHLDGITICYGMTETSPVSFQSSINDSLERRVSTVGRVSPHVQVKVVDAEGRCVPRGVQGELCTRGYSVMIGYWDDEQQTREVLDRAGWLRTGDLGVIDEDGYAHITGRLKDMIIRGGENIYPRELEEYLFRHEKILAVQVFGVPDVKFGEEVCAWIQLKGGVVASEAEIRDFCQGQIAHYKIPRYIRFVSEFPLTATGKVQKFMMREQMKTDFGLVEQRTA
jgi:fatty-acyl-CoA synthase